MNRRRTPPFQSRERKSGVVGDPLDFLMLGIALKYLREEASGLVELLQLNVGKALLQSRIGSEFMLMLLGHLPEMQGGRLMLFLGGIDPAEEIIHPNPLRGGPPLEGVLVLFILIEEPLKGRCRRLARSRPAGCSFPSFPPGWQ